MTSTKTLFARQSIYDGSMNVVAYELLFRSGTEQQANFSDGNAATSSVILNAFTELPGRDILEGKPTFINFCHTLLDAPLLIDRQQLVVEILEGVIPDNKTLESIRHLKSEGYAVALDDYVYKESDHQLLELVDIIKVDVLALGMDETSKQVQQLDKYDLTLLAEKVENHDIFEQCKNLGFALYQGHFLSKPRSIRGTRVDADQQNVLRLLSVLQKEEVEFPEIEELISTHAVLSYKVLRLINSAAFGMPQKIDSIQQAITLLGLDKIRNWASLLALSSLPSKPKALCLNTLIRSHMAQTLAKNTNNCKLGSEGMFTAGMISTMDAFLDQPLKKVVASLNLSNDLSEVILYHSGLAGLILKTAIYFEKAEFSQVDWQQLQQEGLDSEQVFEAYVDSIRWAADTVKELW